MNVINILAFSYRDKCCGVERVTLLKRSETVKSCFINLDCMNYFHWLLQPTVGPKLYRYSFSFVTSAN